MNSLEKRERERVKFIVNRRELDKLIRSSVFKKYAKIYIGSFLYTAVEISREMYATKIKND